MGSLLTDSLDFKYLGPRPRASEVSDCHTVARGTVFNHRRDQGLQARLRFGRYPSRRRDCPKWSVHRMSGTYNYCLVLLSILLAVVMSHTALRLAARVARATGSSAQLWLAGGAISMGTGIWSMHFIGMLALSLPIPLSYDLTPTIGSLCLAIFSSGFALKLASQPDSSLLRLASGSLVMGAGISAMHYVGMTAVQVVPMIRYEPGLVAASVAIAIGASFAALWLFTHLGTEDSWQMRATRLGAAFVMGLAISGMHYTGMAA